MKKNIFVAGHNGMVGSAIKKKLDVKNNVITAEKSDLDLLNLENVKKFFKENRIDEVYLAAAKVGGIYANDTNPVDFIFNNMVIQNNVIHSAFEANIRKLLFLGSSCIYPKFASQPISEECLLTGKLEKTNEPYAIAKISGIKLCESYNRQYHEEYGIDYRCVMPANLYGPGDANVSRLIPGTISKVIAGQKPFLYEGVADYLRDFLFITDACQIMIQLMQLEYRGIINIGTGESHRIESVFETIFEVLDWKQGYETRQKESTHLEIKQQVLNTALLLEQIPGYQFIGLKEGIEKTIGWYRET